MNLKKVLFFTIPILAILTVLGIGAVLNTKADSSEFVIDGTTLARYTGQSSSVSIPVGVRVIADGAFADNSFVTDVTLPGTVDTIGYRAFAGCSNLKSIIIPDSVFIIDDSAFNDDVNLSSVTIGKGLSKLGQGAFSGCDSLKDIVFDNDNYVCKDGVVYDKSMKTVYQYLAGNTLNIYDMPDSVTDIKRYAFWGANYLEEIDFSASLKSVDDYAVTNCPNLKNVILHTPTRSIALGAFSDNISLRQIVSPLSMSKIHDNAFDNCPSDLIFVCENGSYSEEYALTHGFLTSTIKQVAINKRDYINGYPSLSDNNAYSQPDDYFADKRKENNVHTSLKVDEPEGKVVSDSFVVADKAFVSLEGIGITGSEETSIVITNPDDPDRLQDYSHYNSRIISYEIPDNITSIGKLSFARSDINSIIIPDGATTIDYAAFYHCDNLVNVYIPDTVTSIGAHAFEHTPWYNAWLNDPVADDYLIVGDGVLIGYKGNKADVSLPEAVKVVAEGVL